MAKKRMVSNQVVDSDDFIDMSLSAQALYFHLLVRADDEGFINGVKKTMRMIGARDDDLKLLIGKKFVIMFDSGVIVVKHWLLHNTIRKDRLIETVHIKEKELLYLKENDIYTINGSQPSVKRLSHVSHMTDKRQPSDRIDKNRLEEVSIVEIKKEEKKEVKNVKEDLLANRSNTFVESFKDFLEFRKKTKAPMTDKAIKLLLNKLDKETNDEKIQIAMLEQSIMNGWKSVFPLKTNGNGKRYKKELPEDIKVDWLDEFEDDMKNDKPVRSLEKGKNESDEAFRKRINQEYGLES